MKTRDQVLLRRRLIIKVKMRIRLRLNLNITQLMPLSRWWSLIKIMRWWWWDLLAKEAIKLYKYYQCRMRLNKTSSRRSKIILTSFFLYHSIKRRKEYRTNRPANLMSSIKTLLSKINSLNNQKWWSYKILTKWLRRSAVTVTAKIIKAPLVENHNRDSFASTHKTIIWVDRIRCKRWQQSLLSKF